MYLCKVQKDMRIATEDNPEGKESERKNEF